MYDLILIDFSWIYNKYYYVDKIKPHINDDMSDEGVATRVFDMLLRLFRLIRNSYPSSKVMLALDPPTNSVKNFALNREYKQNRDKKEKKKVYASFKVIVEKLIKRLDKNFLFVRSEGYEADQVLAALAENFQEKNVLIFSGDKDLLQLSYFPNVDISDKYEKGAFIVKTDEDIFSKFKNNKGEDFTRISTNKKDILKYRVLKGDTSDNLKPVFPRIKDPEIVSIIKDYWVTEDTLTEDKVLNIIGEVQKRNEKLAAKLQEGIYTWLSNYEIMNLYGLKDIKIKRVVSHG